MSKFNKYFSITLRTLMGALFVFSGLNGFFQFVPPPEGGMSQGAMDLSIALMNSGFLMQMVFAVQLIGGLLLLTGFFVPMGLILLAPIILVILAFHIFLAPEGNAMAIILCLISIYLAWLNKKSFAPLFIK